MGSTFGVPDADTPREETVKRGHDMLIRWYVRTLTWGVQARERLDQQYGATAVEYALMLAFIFMVIFGAVAFMGQQTNSQFSKVQIP
jgi:Flp pilus assembly pilin Flp